MFNKFDLENDPQFQEYKKHIIEELIPKIDGTDVFISLTPSEGKLDVKFAVELGIAILLDKPIVAIICPGAKVSDKFRKVVDRFIELDIKDQASHPKITEALNEIMKDEWWGEKNENVDPDDVDVQFAIELGYIVMLDKPVIAAVGTGSSMSRKFSQIVDRFVELGEEVNNLSSYDEAIEFVENHQGMRETIQELKDEGTIKEGYDPWKE